MQKTRLGISVGLMGAAVYLVALFGGYIPLILVAGYILLFEENQWLKRSAIKAAVIVFALALLTALIGFIPNATELIGNIFSVFNRTLHIPVLPGIISLINTIIFIVQKVLLIFLAIRALTQSNVPIDFVDQTINKHMEAPVANTGMPCSRCGTVMAPEKTFCSNCGNRLYPPTGV